MKIQIQFKDDEHLNYKSGSLFIYIDITDLKIDSETIYFKRKELPCCFKLKYIESIKVVP